MTHFHPDSDAVQSLDQLKLVWQMCVKERGTGDVRDEPDLMIRWADNAFPFWNTLALQDVGADRERLAHSLGKAARYMRSQSQAGFLWIFEDLLAADARGSLPEAARQAGLQFGFGGFGMAADILPLAEEPRHPDLEFVRVSTDEHLAAYADLNCRAYGFPKQGAEEGFAGSQIWKNQIHAYLGLLDGVPVSAAGAVAADDCLFVILVATAPEHERKGYGGATTRKALYEGGKATGLKRATLHATAAGMPVYERIGFRKVAAVSFYALET
ncbi:GNAT family N-acetyltransferase [Jiella mangrovi]|uniref:GNAT family N-acetyltransferase n=1 Tax=Jiella mangrovi TaxID=2821407 RepID=A0ABS4BG78_9HYPH|nr:GNAT family N-acetyltransferase [Jiella mangrovi]MBP0615765.1 GNAT family N-acetyltransferase [Jiella mangrovi]